MHTLPALSHTTPLTCREHDDEEERRKDSKKHRKDKERSGGSERANGHAEPYSSHGKEGREASGRSGRVSSHDAGQAPAYGNHDARPSNGNGNDVDMEERHPAENVSDARDLNGGDHVVLPGPPPLGPSMIDAAADDTAPDEVVRSAGASLVAYDDDAPRAGSEDRDSGEIREDGERR